MDQREFMPPAVVEFLQVGQQHNHLICRKMTENLIDMATRL
jgi:hypothetical protein